MRWLGGWVLSKSVDNRVVAWRPVLPQHAQHAQQGGSGGGGGGGGGLLSPGAATPGPASASQQRQGPAKDGDVELVQVGGRWAGRTALACPPPFPSACRWSSWDDAAHVRCTLPPTHPPTPAHLQELALEDAAGVWWLRFALDYWGTVLACGTGAGRVLVFDPHAVQVGGQQHLVQGNSGRRGGGPILPRCLPDVSPPPACAAFRPAARP